MTAKLSDIEKMKNKNIRNLLNKAKKEAKVKAAPATPAPKVEKGKIYLGKDPLTGEKLYQ